ncbi:MAG: tRNA (adenosine(37)-N6)-dimethylallyltransferase MiaA [Polyangiales bacterium]
MTPDPEAPLLVITGPTASGKTALAVALAKAHGGALIGADSVQVYRGFDIGSSKPTAAELDGVPHHLLDVRDPDQPLDAADYAALADAAIAGVRAQGKLPIVVGGSGLWLRALLRGLVPLPKVDPVLRARLSADADALGSPALHARLALLDPLAAARLHENDRVRILRALEVHAQTGEPLGALRQTHALGAPRYRALRVALTLPPDVLAARIEARTEAMFAAGLVDEVRGLLARWGTAPRALGAVGYREVVAHLTDGVSLDETTAKVARATRVYARRQRTWLRREPGDRWDAHPDEVGADDGRARIARFLSPPG